jgi:Na+-driven multidrug efflux pump
MATYAGQNTGAAKPARIRQGLNAAMLLSAVWSLVFLAAVWFFTPQMCALFLSAASRDVVSFTQKQLVICALTSIFLAAVNVYRFTLQGIGYSLLAILSGVIEMFARALTAIFVVPKLGFLGVCLASPAAWVFADCFLVPACLVCIGRLERRLKEAARVRALADGDKA